MHADQITITADQARRLVAEQWPESEAMPVRHIQTSGTENAIFRVGEVFTARFPMRAGDPHLIRAALHAEMAAAREFCRLSPVPSPKVVFIGAPGCGFPLPWLIQTWVPGVPATPTSCADSVALADDLASLIQGLRGADTHGRTFTGQGRGGVLADHDEFVAESIRRCEGLFDTSAMRRLWAGFRTLPREDADAMCHTDLIPGNVLVDSGRLSGILDAGGFKAADPALDLVAGWHLLDKGPRSRLRRGLECSDLQWERGKAWAFQQASGALWYYQTVNPEMADVGRTTLERIVAD